MWLNKELAIIASDFCLTNGASPCPRRRDGGWSGWLTWDASCVGSLHRSSHLLHVDLRNASIPSCLRHLRWPYTTA